MRSDSLVNLEMLRATIDVVSELGDLVCECAGLGYSIGANWASDLNTRRTHDDLFGPLYVLAIP